MGMDGHVIIIDKEKAEQWSKERNIDLYWHNWYEYDIYGHKVMVHYYEYDTDIYCPFCKKWKSAFYCKNPLHENFFKSLKKYACVADWEVWT